jgi:hypothetical protein
LGGKLVLHQYFAYLSDKFFNEQAAKGFYNADDLTEVRLSVNMPGITDWKDYENISGQIQFQNVSYNYVKMKITRNAMYLMCIPNYKATSLTNDNVICAKGIKEIPVPKKDHVPYQKSNSLNKFRFEFVQFEFSVFSTDLPKISIQSTQNFSCNPLDIPEQPPKHFC